MATGAICGPEKNTQVDTGGFASEEKNIAHTEPFMKWLMGQSHMAKASTIIATTRRALILIICMLGRMPKTWPTWPTETELAAGDYPHNPSFPLNGDF